MLDVSKNIGYSQRHIPKTMLSKENLNKLEMSKMSCIYTKDSSILKQWFCFPCDPKVFPWNVSDKIV